MKMILLLLFITQAHAIEFKNGKFINDKGTKKETIVYQYDSVEWRLVSITRDGKRFSTPVPSRSTMNIWEGFDCKIAYETQPKGDTMFGKMNVRSKVLYCEFKANKKKVDFHSMCFLDEKKSVPMESLGKAKEPGSMYLECEPKLLR